MTRQRVLSIAAVLVLAAVPLVALTVNTPKGAAEVFARGDLIDLIELLRLTGADVQFAPAAGSYNALLDAHEAQFTPGGNLAVIDGKLVSLPGPVRTLEGHVVGSLATAGALLAPLGWSLRGTAAAPELVASGGDRLEVARVASPTGTLAVVRGTAQRPRLGSAPGIVTLTFAGPVTLGAPVPVEAELLGGDLREGTLTLRLAPGIEVASTYPLDDPPRFVLKLESSGTTAASAPATGEARTGPLVVLDPGHGGEDQGAKGPAGELEKDITLALARLVAGRLQAAGVTARLTRDGDEGVPLADRTALANRLRADAFVSIHANASPARGAKGAETYFMNVDASDPQAAQSAARENASAPADTVQLILWDLAHVANITASSRLARGLQGRLDALQGIRDRGVKQAPFVVLTGATAPAALVEVGFLSNPDEAARLTGRASQDELADALSEAIVGFLRTAEVATEPSPTP